MTTVLAIIPARSGSKGVVDKNIRTLAGFPLLAYSIKAAQQSASIERIIVSTDAIEYADIAKHYGAEAPFIRPAALSGDGASDYQFVQHLLSWLDEQQQSLPQYIVHLRPTTPLREFKYIDAAISKMMSSKEFTALRSVHKMPESAYKAFEIEVGLLTTMGDKSFHLDRVNHARQQFPVTYAGNGYVDVLLTEHILSQQCLHGCRVAAFETPRVIEVDDLEDLRMLEMQVMLDDSLVKQLFYGQL